MNSLSQIELIQLQKRASEVLENQEFSQKWLSSPQIGLGGKTPLDFAKTPEGFQAVLDLLGRIEMGVYS